MGRKLVHMIVYACESLASVLFVFQYYVIGKVFLGGHECATYVLYAGWSCTLTSARGLLLHTSLKGQWLQAVIAIVLWQTAVLTGSRISQVRAGCQ
jgi:hypothetical protein